MKEKELVPNRRFKEFQNTDAWEQRKLEDVAKKIGSGKTPKGGSSVYIQSGIPLLRSQNINNDRVNFEEVVCITKSMDDEMSNSRVMPNDVLLNITGASIGRSAVYELAGPANVNQHVCIIRPNLEINPYFIQLNITSVKGQKQIDVNQAGGAREGLNFQQVGKMSFAYPKYNEQNKIGSFFKHLDEMITLEQRKIDKTKALKSAYLAEMFPAEGERVPKRRFEEFSKPWEHHKLSELTELYVGKSFTTVINRDGKYIVMDMGSVSQEGFRLEHKRTCLKRDLLKKNDLVMPKDDIGGGLIIGKTAHINKDNAYVLGDHVYRLRFRYNDGLFMHYRINSKPVNLNLKRKVTGSAQLGISSASVLNQIITLPSIKEQQKIGGFFKSLDNIITTQEQKLAKLRATKQAYLHEMFV